jgi:hypothetical protein
VEEIAMIRLRLSTIRKNVFQVKKRYLLPKNDFRKVLRI